MAEFRWQHVNFYFAVSFNGLDAKHVDASFQSVTGLNVEIQTETIREGGENHFEHVIPGRRRYTDLVLKRGILTGKEKSLVYDWCKDAFELNHIRPIDLDVILLNENGDPLMKWKVIHAWPKSWKVGDMNAERGEVLIETIELAYHKFEFENV